jgi:general secretion pathway protein D
VRLSCLRILVCILAACALAVPVFAEKASDVFRDGEKQEKAGHIVKAYLLYAQASALDPGNKVYRAKTALLKPRAEQLQIHAADPIPTDPEPEPIAKEPEPQYDSISAWELASARKALPPSQLKLTSGSFDFHFSGDARDLFDQIAARCGIQTIFDSEYAPLKVRFDVDDVDCRVAIHAAETATNSFVATLSSKLMLISKDTVAKRTANEQTMSVVIPIPSAVTPQDLTEISQAVKQVTGIEKLGFNAASGEILIRDRVSRVVPAMALLDQLISYRGGVLIEMRFLQLTDSDILSYGINMSNTFNILYQGIANPTLASILNVLSQGRNFGISALQASVVANLTKSSSRTILQTQMRAVSGVPAIFHVGEKYPVLTSSYIGGTTASTAGAYTPPPSFTYFDLGVSLKITPIVSNDLVTMDFDSDYQLLGGSSIDGIPILNDRKFTTRIALHRDEWALIGGLMEETRTKSVSGVAGLANIPLLGWLFKTENKEKDRGHIVILIKPYVIGEAPGENPVPAMAVGTDTRPFSPL